MKKWLRWVAAGAAAAVIVPGLGGCAEPRYVDDATRPTIVLDGPSVAFTVADQRLAVAAFGPPAPLLLMRVGPEYFWATSAPALRDVYVQEMVDDQPAGSHVLVTNRAGTVDAVYALRWSGGRQR